MGRARKPVEALTGHQTQEDINDKKHAESFVADMPNDELQIPPDWLCDEVAREEWLRVAPLLENYNIICNADLNNLAVYCNTYSQYRRITRALSKTSITKGNQVNDNFERLSVQQKNCAELMRKYAGVLGLTIDSRLKAAAIKAKDEDDAIKGEFGDI